MVIDLKELKMRTMADAGLDAATYADRFSSFATSAPLPTSLALEAFDWVLCLRFAY